MLYKALSIINMQSLELAYHASELCYRDPTNPGIVACISKLGRREDHRASLSMLTENGFETLLVTQVSCEYNDRWYFLFGPPSTRCLSLPFPRGNEYLATLRVDVKSTTYYEAFNGMAYPNFSMLEKTFQVNITAYQIKATLGIFLLSKAPNKTNEIPEAEQIWRNIRTFTYAENESHQDELHAEWNYQRLSEAGSSRIVYQLGFQIRPRNGSKYWKCIQVRLEILKSSFSNVLYSARELKTERPSPLISWRASARVVSIKPKAECATPKLYYGRK